MLLSPLLLLIMMFSPLAVVVVAWLSKRIVFNAKQLPHVLAAVLLPPHSCALFAFIALISIKTRNLWRKSRSKFSLLTCLLCDLQAAVVAAAATAAAAADIAAAFRYFFAAVANAVVRLPLFNAAAAAAVESSAALGARRNNRESEREQADVAMLRAHSAALACASATASASAANLPPRRVAASSARADGRQAGGLAVCERAAAPTTRRASKKRHTETHLLHQQDARCSTRSGSLQTTPHGVNRVSTRGFRKIRSDPAGSKRALLVARTQRDFRVRNAKFCLKSGATPTRSLTARVEWRRIVLALVRRVFFSADLAPEMWVISLELEWNGIFEKKSGRNRGTDSSNFSVCIWRA